MPQAGLRGLHPAPPPFTMPRFPKREVQTRMAQRILVADELAPEGLEALKASGMQYDEKTGLTPEQLAAEVGNYDALIVRSKAKVPAKVLANPGKLRIIARAGVGDDTMDL